MVQSITILEVSNQEPEPSLDFSIAANIARCGRAFLASTSASQMPLQASIMDKLALLRGVRFIENNHDLREVYTGLPRPAQRPAFGSIISRFSPRQTELPRYVALSPWNG